MIKTRLFKRTFLLLVIVGALDLLAIYLYLFWTIWWFDMLVHFLAGCCVAMASILVYSYFIKQNIFSFTKALAVAILGAMLIGIIWELFELSFHITFLSDGFSYFLDTSSDILMDFSGGIIGAFYAQKILTKDNKI